MLQLLLGKHSRQWLICPARYPLVTTGSLRGEALLYNLDKNALEEVCAEFKAYTGKAFSPESELCSLSGGQKVLLMCLLALHSPAPCIHFLDLWHSLDANNRERIQSLLHQYGQTREILLEDSPDAH
ncbi:MAG TPA: hypothetical protein PKH21_05020 [Candidatus Cloacimonadota bacterium]|jgi:ABC-type cobalamin/Fe3+-siderophores transport system ATPase subunit|nr:hypothetical protein [Candidatus Cloacimonadota bacterium]HOF59384.1 hypothetical protein [Candidatus Cloacimonadota bacterium]HOR58534.1 hypothetical protein [Candidatus Cloacimonadota bacterium]HQL12999.1 hypothetical protein [Candidatus Cloacimonadota bacterium]HQO44037.1 hypothetical protein [Candidatus Cloacimonadota bacterium]